MERHDNTGPHCSNTRPPTAITISCAWTHAVTTTNHHPPTRPASLMGRLRGITVAHKDHLSTEPHIERFSAAGVATTGDDA